MKTLKCLLAFIFLFASVQLGARPTDLKSSVNVAVKSYLDIKNALAADNSKMANAAAKKFTEALKNIQTDQMDARQKEAWQKYHEKLRYDGDHIGEATAIAHQREHFGSLSANMYALAKAFKDNEITLYQQYCPMAKKSWISESATIKNPYFGKEMPECGTTKEEIKASK